MSENRKTTGGHRRKNPPDISMPAGVSESDARAAQMAADLAQKRAYEQILTDVGKVLAEVGKSRGDTNTIREILLSNETRYVAFQRKATFWIKAMAITLIVSTPIFFGTTAFVVHMAPVRTEQIHGLQQSVSDLKEAQEAQDARMRRIEKIIEEGVRK